MHVSRRRGASWGAFGSVAKAFALGGVVCLSAALAGAEVAASQSRPGAEIDVVRLETARLGFVGLSGPFTSQAADRPARLLATTSFGAKFADVSPPSSRATRVDDVSFLDREHGWAVIFNIDTVRVTVYRTSDGGRSWLAAPAGSHSENAGAVATVQFLTCRLGWLVIQEPTAPAARLLRTVDGGASWRAVSDLPEVAPVWFSTATEALAGRRWR
jgi:hypothetical protein